MTQTCLDSIRRAWLAGALACLAPAAPAGDSGSPGGSGQAPGVASPPLAIAALNPGVAPHPRLLREPEVGQRDRLPTVCWHHHSAEAADAARVAGAGAGAGAGTRVSAGTRAGARGGVGVAVGERTPGDPERALMLNTSPDEKEPQLRGNSEPANDAQGEESRWPRGPQGGHLHWPSTVPLGTRPGRSSCGKPVIRSPGRGRQPPEVPPVGFPVRNPRPRGSAGRGIRRSPLPGSPCVAHDRRTVRWTVWAPVWRTVRVPVWGPVWRTVRGPVWRSLRRPVWWSCDAEPGSGEPGGPSEHAGARGRLD